MSEQYRPASLEEIQARIARLRELRAELQDVLARLAAPPKITAKQLANDGKLLPRERF